ncbi:hypothetical protein [Streptomyces sp. NPDC059491]|uniref:hypothetical protein n=1 Tax=Streptomyces sp. NPDC059491 TaxID=3346850 RepID=UPI00369B967F
MVPFELMDVSPVPEGRGARTPPREARQGEPVVLWEGAAVSLALTFRVGEEVAGLVVEMTWLFEGKALGTTRAALGGFRPGGPYEVHLPPERLPVGRAQRGSHAAECRVLDAGGRELARAGIRFRVVHPDAPVGEAA